MRIRQMASRVIVALSILHLPISGAAQEGSALSLESAVALVQQNNPQLMALRREIAAAKGGGWTTWWLTDPNLSLEWEGVPSGAGLGQFAERKLTLTQEIEFPTNILWRNRFAAREVEAAAMRYEQGVLAIRADAVTAYTRFLASRDELALAQQRVQLAQEFVDKAEIRRRAGDTPAIELLRAQVELAQAQNELRTAESAHIAAQAGLNALLARKPDEKTAVKDSLAYQQYALSLVALKRQALTEHPRLREADALVNAASHLRNLAWGSFLPAVELSAFRHNIGGNPNFYGAQIGLKVPLWFAFRQRGEIQEASALLTAQEHQRANVELQLLAEIESAYAAFEAAQRQAESYTTSLLAQAGEVYRIALRSYEQGETGYLQLLEAQQTLIEVRQGYIAALASYYAAIAALENASSVIIIR
ncbi:TolC family protein [candidate division KSB1 bacterium]|nr:TolC family protein [candidate division KSB1 bacterium]